jgi:hypothetical protein
MMRVQFYGELVEEMYDSGNSMGRHTFLNFVTILDPAGAEVVAFFRIRGGPRARVACLPGVANARRSAARAGAPTFSGASGTSARFAGPPRRGPAVRGSSPWSAPPPRGTLRRIPTEACPPPRRAAGTHCACKPRRDVGSRRGCRVFPAACFPRTLPCVCACQ